MTTAVITPQDLAELCKVDKQIDLIDVRTPVEYREVHVEIARNVPLDQLDPEFRDSLPKHCLTPLANWPRRVNCRRQWRRNIFG